MAATIPMQYAYRSQKKLGMVESAPSYQPLQGFEDGDVTARTYQYSPGGKLFAYALPTCVRICNATDGSVVRELPIPNVIELNFSPRGTFLSTWERPIKLDDGAQHKNLRVISVGTGEEVISFTQKSQDGWDLQYSANESHAVRLVGQEVQVFNPNDWANGVADKLRVEGATSISLSSGLEPCLAVFVAERKGQPATIKLYKMRSLALPPVCQKTFFKADRAQIKWNQSGTQVLVLTQTEVDQSGKSYYGETQLYLLSASGNFDCRVTLDKDGPIHDFAWNPNSKEFGVVYGFMPMKTVIFDQRVKTLHDFGPAPHNFISFNPQGRLVAIAGFGNLAGKIDIFDRRSLNKVATIDASNTSHCEWSPDGRYLITATLSPRLRVDNGIKIWHCAGSLLHHHPIEELYQASWRRMPAESLPGFPGAIPTAPEASTSVAALPAAQLSPAAKPVGAYRPPGARGLATPTIFKREDEGGAVYRSPNGTSTPPRQNGGRSPAPPGSAPNGHGHANGRGERSAGRRHVPGAAPASTPPQDGQKKGRAKKKRGKDEGEENGVPEDQPASQTSQAETTTNGPDTQAVDTGVPQTPGVEGMDPIAKKIRNLNKKLKAIEELKEKAKRGERLEMTQLKKMEGESELRKELAGLGAPSA